MNETNPYNTYTKLLHWGLKQWVLVVCLRIEMYDAYLHDLSSASDRRIHESSVEIN